LYTVGIEDPEKEDQVKVTLRISDLSVVTSGDYQRYYEVDGKRYCHIIDPDTMVPAEYYRSVTVIAKSSAFADALSTALFNMEYDKGYALVHSFDDVEAMWVLQDGTVQYSSNFEQYIK
ncbi:MAG: FAD:protein FMN transferase, partial [Lachnospiraceae bacterium]|nr:FAD:protein FMN transferase [Lachnospiraceae bacterium]